MKTSAFANASSTSISKTTPCISLKTALRIQEFLKVFSLRDTNFQSKVFKTKLTNGPT
jgi:hypothetical protein